MAQWYEGCKFSTSEIDEQQAIVEKIRRKIPTTRANSTESSVTQKKYEEESALLNYMEKNQMSMTDRPYTAKEMKEQQQEINRCYRIYAPQSQNINDKASKAKRNMDQAEAKLKHMERFNQELAKVQQLQQKPRQATNTEKNTEQKQESKSQPTTEKTTIQTYPPELENQISEKKNELGKFIKTHDHIVRNLSTQHNQLVIKDDQVKKVRTQFDEAKESVASFKQKIDSLDGKLKQKQAALAKINQSFVKRLINIFTGEKGKLTNEISTIQQSLNFNKKKMESQEKIVRSCTMNLETYKEETKEIVKKLGGLEQLNQISDQLKNVKKELPENIKPLLSPQIEKIENAVNNSIKAANNTMKYGENIIASTKIEKDDKKKEMKVLTLEASDKSESSRLGKNNIDKNKEVSRA